MSKGASAAASEAIVDPNGDSSLSNNLNHLNLNLNMNPLLNDDLWALQPYHMPPFANIEPHHFPPAFATAMQLHRDELDAIADNSTEMPPPTFENTIAPLDRAGRLFRRIEAVFDNLCLSYNTADLQKIEADMSPIVSRHHSACSQHAALFQRIQTVYDQRHDDTLQKTNLNHHKEQVRLIERFYLDFTRMGGAHLSSTLQAQLADAHAELASLHTQFSQNVMQSESDFELWVTREDLVGCPESLIDAARTLAQEKKLLRGQPSSDHSSSSSLIDDEHNDRASSSSVMYVLSLSRSMVEPFLTFSSRRDLRQMLWESWVQRGEEKGNLDLAVHMLKKRQQIAHIHGYENYAAYQCADRMAQTPTAVMELLENVWTRAREATNKERHVLHAFAIEQGWGDEYRTIEAYDWRYLAEKVRVAQYDIDEALFKPYLSLKHMREALFAVSTQLFGLQYTKREDIALYHPDAEAFEVHELLPEKDGARSRRLVALFVHDNFARAFKKSGAWMSEYRTQHRNSGTESASSSATTNSILTVPIVSNNNNFAKGNPHTLLSLDDAKTLFHEFGHAHHGMLSNVTYERLASTNVLTDFVELPSQLMEHWLDQRSVLQQYARHYQTGEAIPDAWLDQLAIARNFQQGFKTVEYTICALLDMALHQLDTYEDLDLAEFERAFLEKVGMPQGVVMRHRPAHFLHLFASSHYAAGYYVYLWAEVLDKDAFAAFTEAGDIFDPDTAARLRQFIYGAGNTEAPDTLFRQFRGRDPKIEYMLRHKGLLHEESY